MKLELPSSVTRAVSRQLLVGRKNAPQILFATGIAGFIGTTVLASRATLRVEKVLDKHDESLGKIHEAQEKYPKQYTTEHARSDRVIVYTDTALELTKLYGPVVAVGAVSIVCLSKSNSILQKRNAGLIAAYGALDTSFRQYRSRVKEEVGGEREYELYRESQNRALALDESELRIDELEGVVKPAHYSIYSRYFAQSKTASWSPVPEMNFNFLRAQQIYVNDKLKLRGHVFLNEVYDALGLDRSPEGAVVGWVYGGDGNNFIDFGCWGYSKDSRNGNIGGFSYDPETDQHVILLDFNVDGVIFRQI